MAVIDIDSQTVGIGVLYGLMRWDGDAYALTPKGEEWLRSWIRAQKERLTIAGQA